MLLIKVRFALEIVILIIHEIFQLREGFPSSIYQPLLLIQDSFALAHPIHPLPFFLATILMLFALFLDAYRVHQAQY